MKRFTRAECLLFVVPFLIFPIYWLTQKAGLTPPSAPLPKPTPTPGPRLLTDHVGEWFAILPSADGKKIVTRSDMSSLGLGSTQVWDAKSLQMSFAVDVPHGMVPLALTPDSQHLIAAGGDSADPSHRRALVYSLTTRQQVLQMPDGTGTTTEIAVSPNGKTIALGHRRSLDLRELKTGHLLRRLPRWLPEAAVSYADTPTFSPDGKSIAFVDDLAGGDVYDNGKGDEIGIFSVESGRRLRVFGWPHVDIRDIAFSPDGKYLVAIAWISTRRPRREGKADDVKDRVFLCDTRTGEVRHSLPTRPQMHALVFSPDGRWLAAGSHGEGVQLWDTHSWKLHLDRTGTNEDPVYDLRFVNDLGFTADSRTLLVGANKVLRLPVSPQL